MSKYYQVAVNFPKVKSVFSYGASSTYSTGDLVDIPFGKRKAKGAVLRESESSEIHDIPAEKFKNIIGLIEKSFPLSDKELQLYHWMSKYYHYSLGKLIFDCMPKFLKRPRSVDFIHGKSSPLPFKLNEDQSLVLSKIKHHLDLGFSQHYLHGVTGSGKSAVYLELIKECISKGESVQFLLPEINLTPQFTQMFETYLDCEILTYHSGVSDSEKFHIWKTLKERSTPVLVMGVRSSIFLPLSNLGLIIIDEEHDSSFKQTDRCPYNGRDVAIKKAQIHCCPVILGSATPTVENYFQFEGEREQRHYYSLKNRVGSGSFPELVLLDTKDKFSENDSQWPFLTETIIEIEKRLRNKEQVLVFINKLGFSHYIQCRNCGHQFRNEKCGCENNLRYFKKKNCLSCAHCEFVMPLPSQCPECGSISLVNKGFGTEKVEQVLGELFPDFQTERFDRDEIKTTKDLSLKLDRFHRGEIDILVGTQMLAKGHNFERVNLVVILGIDASLNYADFRSSEKTYQLVEQVAGRSGRFSEGAKVIIQTMNTEHDVFKHIQAHAFEQFYQGEMPLRKLCECPPYSRLAMLYFSSRFRQKIVDESQKVAQNLSNLIHHHKLEVAIFGPTPLAVEKKAGQFSWAIMLKSTNINQLHQVVASFEAHYEVPSNLSYKIDVDPLYLL